MSENNKIFETTVICELQKCSGFNTSYFHLSKSKYDRTVFWYGCHLLLMKDGVVQVEKTFQSGILDVVIKESDLFILLDTGSLYRMKIQRSKKSKKDKSKKTGVDTVQDDWNQNIFSGLLDQQKLPTTQEDHSEEFLFSFPGVSYFTFDSSKAVTLTFSENICNILFYPVQILSDSQYINKEITQYTERCEILHFNTNFQLCKSSALSSMQVKVSQEKVPVNIKSRNFVCFKASQEKSNTSHNVTEKSCLLQSSLFTQLFGKTISLHESSVLLIALPNGHVNFIPMIQILKSKEVPHSVLCDLEQPIASIHGLKLEKGDSFVTERSSSTISCDLGVYDCLAIIGVYGKILLLYLGDDDNSICHYEDQLPGPVYASVVVNNAVIHSNLLNMYSSQCWIEKGSKLKRLSQEMLGFHNAVHISALASKPGQASPLHMMDLIVATHYGRMYKLKVNLNGIGRKLLPSSASVGQQVGDLLTSISNLSVKLDQVNGQMTRQDQTIKQLSLASVITGAYNTQSMNSEVPFDISVNVDQRHSGVNTTYTLVVCLTGSKGVSFAENWHASLVVSSQKSEFEKKHYKVAKTVKLMNVSEGQNQEIAIELLKDQLCEMLPLNVDVCLVLAVPAKCKGHPSSASGSSIPYESSVKHITMPCYSATVDILHVLRPNSSSSLMPGLRTDPLFKSSVESAIAEISKQMPCSEFYREEMSAKDDEKRQSKENITCTVTVPEAVSHHFVYSCRKGTKPENCLLEVLFTDNKLMKQAVTDQVHVKMLSPSNNQVLLSIITTQKPGSTIWEIHVQTFCVQELCAMRMAVIHRIQDLHKNVEKLPIEDNVSTHQLRKYIRQIDAIQDEVESLQSSEIDVKNNGDKLKNTVQLYSMLRNTTI